MVPVHGNHGQQIMVGVLKFKIWPYPFICLRGVPAVELSQASDFPLVPLLQYDNGLLEFIVLLTSL